MSLCDVVLSCCNSNTSLCGAVWHYVMKFLNDFSRFCYYVMRFDHSVMWFYHDVVWLCGEVT